MALTELALTKIRHDSDLRAKIMLVDSKSEYTVKRWIEGNDDELTKPKYTTVIAEHTGLELDQILEPQTATA